ncbi:MAG: hypothetical protein ABSF69_14350 [Polyangiaceae bacterium]|jgi:hypothetical protein
MNGARPFIWFSDRIVPPNGNGISAAAKCAIVGWAAAGALNN